MRWRYFDSNNVQEAAERAAVLDRIDAWWAAFEGKIPAIHDLMAQRMQWDLAAWMSQTLQGISPDLMWEFSVVSGQEGATGSQRLRLVITPESRRDLRPLVDVILARAPVPAQAPGWEFCGYRQPEPYSLARHSLLSRESVDLDQLTVEARIGEHNQIDLVYQGQGEFGMSQIAALLATEALLGEEVMDRWVGVISVKPAVHGMGKLVQAFKKTQGKAAIHLDGRVSAMIQMITDQLAQEPTFMRNRVDGPELRRCEHTLMRIKSAPAPAAGSGPALSYPGVSDVFIAVSEDPRLWYAQHMSGRFDSARYSQRGEVFCYVKLDDTGVASELRADRRYQLHQALDHALITAGKGCVTGGATGLCHTYLDLAVLDFEVAAGLVKDVLRQAGVGKQGWILFCDATLAQEWVGVYDDTPAPVVG